MLVVRERNSVRLNASRRAVIGLGLPEKGRFEGVVRRYRVMGSFDFSGYCFRMRLPNYVKNLFYDGERRIDVMICMDGDSLLLFYRAGEECRVVSFARRPDYRRGVYWCGRCDLGFPMDYCPSCRGKTRKKPRKQRREY